MATVTDTGTDTATITMTTERLPFARRKYRMTVALMVAGFVALAFFSVTSVLSSLARDRSPQTAIRLSPVDGFSYGYLGSSLLEEAGSGEGATIVARDPEQLLQLSRKGLSLEITDSRAMSNLALASEQLGYDQADVLYGKALQMSRRNSLAQYYFIRQNAEKFDYPATLARVSQLLRVEPETQQVLLPFLVQLLSIEESLRPLYELISEQGDWVDGFWQTASKSEELLPNLVRLRLMFGEDDTTIKRRNDEFIADALVRAGRYADAWDFSRRVFPELQAASGGELLQNGDFKRQPVTRPYDWQLFSDGTRSAAINENSGELIITLFKGQGGPIASQMVRLPNTPVTVRGNFESSVENLEDVSLTLVCLDGDTPNSLAEIPLENLSRPTRIANSAGCRNAVVAIYSGAQESSTPRDIFISSLSLTGV